MKQNLKNTIACLGLLYVGTGWAGNWNLTDAQFAKCVAEAATRHNWQQADQVTDITCHSMAIESIAGVKAFSQLRILSLHNNQLKEVDVTGLAELQTLNVANNQLQTLSVHNLAKLQTLLAFGNQLNQMELRQLPLLKTLKANTNKMVQFNYENLPTVERLVLFDNLMPTIDYLHLPALKLLDIRQNPMPDKLYEEMNKATGITIMHDGNAPDWK